MNAGVTLGAASFAHDGSLGHALGAIPSAGPMRDRLGVDEAMRILLVEDNPADAALVREVLAEDPTFEFTLRHVPSLSAARSALDDFTPDVVLTDLSLPDGQGLETFRTIASWDVGAPIVILTGLDDTDVAVEAVREGAQDYIPKSDLHGIMLARVLRYAIERNHTERVVAARERRWRAMIERSSDVITLIDRDLRTMFVSDSVEAHTGISPESLIGRNLVALVHPEDREHVQTTLQDILGSERNASATFRLRARGDTWSWWEAVATNLLEDPAVGAIVVNARDITERKRAEAESERHKRTLQHSIDALPGVFYLFDDSCRLRLWNENLETVTQRASHDLEDIHPADLVVETADANAAGRAALDTGSATVEANLLAADGAHIPYYFTARRVHVDGARYVVGMGLDMTDRNATQRQLEFQASLLAEVSNSVIATDAEGRVTYWNSSAEEVYGWTRDEALGRSVAELTVPEDNVDAAAEILEQVARTGAWEGEFPVKDKMGNVFPSWTSLTRVEGEDGRAGFLGVSADIRDRKRAEEVRKKLVWELGERVKELRLLHEASLILQDESADLYDVFARLAERMPPAWQFPEQAATRIRYEHDGHAYQASSDGFRDTRWLQEASFETSGPGAGTIEVAYLEEPPSREDTLFLPEERALLESLTQMLSAYLDRRHVRDRNEALTRDLSAQLSRLGAMQAISEATLSGLGLHETLAVILDQTMSELNVDAADLLLLDPVEQRLNHAASRGFRRRGIETTSLRLGEGMGGKSALERTAIAVPDVRAPGIEFKPPDLVDQEGFASYYSVPLIAKGRLQGVLGMFHRSRLAFSQEWRDVAKDIAQHAAVAIDNASLFEDLQRSKTELELSYDRTIEGWARALDLKDEETAGHSQRVTALTVALARKLGFSGEALANIRRGALLHDIGKMGVPDRILLKPGKLDAEEWQIMKRHTTYARDFLADIPFLADALDIPYAHHERWDGTGYPQGLRGNEIPFAARIFAVVDVYDALTSDRPYRPAWTHEAAIEHIREEAGSHFDPKVVDAFLAHVEATELGFDSDRH